MDETFAWDRCPIDLDPERVAEQLTEETGDDWTAEKVLDAYERFTTAIIKDKARDAILDMLAEGTD
jgi:non-homologous end joining protein Ku